MEFKAYQNQLRALASRLNFMVIVLLSFALANVLMAGFIWSNRHHYQIEITPFTGQVAYSKTDSRIDSHYLSQMTENFIYSRFNVTPETVKINHERLLRHVDSQRYAVFLNVLQAEANTILRKKIASHFDLLAIQVNPHTLTAQVRGVLKRAVGLRLLKEEKVNYYLTFRYHLGHLSILRFVKQSEKNHA